MRFKRISKIIFIAVVFVGFSVSSCKNQQYKQSNLLDKTATTKSLFFKLSLAQWSLHRYVEEDKKSPFHFASQAKEMGFEGLEYVSQLYEHEINKLGFDVVIDSLKILSEKESIQNVLIMVDDEGDLADPDENKRNQAVENHKKWVDAASKLGCHSIRVNTFGTNDPQIWKSTVVDGLRKLSEYAATKNINVLCENHGWLSSNPVELMKAINEVNMENCGTLPDFGNWCVRRADADEKWGDCAEVYPDKYEGTKMMMPSAMAVSAKSYNFDKEGNETTIDFLKMMQIVKDAGYTGFVGVEYEGDVLNESKGIKATKDLLLSVAAKLK
jgi:sugar phosphate isomerase/epimerase